MTSRDERGATAVEYGLLAALVIVAFIVTIDVLFDLLGALFEETAGNMDD